jgi:hypothetical protein
MIKGAFLRDLFYKIEIPLLLVVVYIVNRIKTFSCRYILCSMVSVEESLHSVETFFISVEKCLPSVEGFFTIVEESFQMEETINLSHSTIPPEPFHPKGLIRLHYPNPVEGFFIPGEQHSPALPLSGL